MTERLIPHRRILAARGQAHVPREFLESLFTAELLRPSRRLFLVSPWISDIAVIQNIGRRYASLDPTWEAGEVLLSKYIATFLGLGSSIALVMNDSKHNDWIIDRLDSLRLGELYPEKLIVRQMKSIHAKGIVGDHFALTGSMNITFNGVHINDEYIDYTAQPGIVHETLTQFTEYLGQDSQ